MNDRSIAVFILTHGRAENVQTYKTLRTHGYTGKIFLLIDDEDDQEERYREIYGDQVLKFCKEEYVKKSLCINPDKPRKVILYARNACFDKARENGITHFVEMDDDYSAIQWRYDDGKRLRAKEVTDLDSIFRAFFDYMEQSGAISVAFGQGGDLLGGKNSVRWKKQVLRKAMNSFFCRTDTPVGFIGAINEDVNTYVSKGNRGDLFFTILRIILVQGETQKNKGGMTETYTSNGTYVKTFPTIMLNPSCAKVSMMGGSDKRIHHRIYWNNAVPKILNEKYRK